MSSRHFLFYYKYLNNQIFKVDTFSRDYYNLWKYENSVLKKVSGINGKPD